MNKIIEYVSVEAVSAKLAGKVNNLIHQGYEPFGNVYPVGGLMFCQPMVLREGQKITVVGALVEN